MSSNPFESTSVPVQKVDSVRNPLDWRAIFVAGAIWFGVGLVVAFGRAIMAMPSKGGPTMIDLIDSRILMAINFIAACTPTVVGALYLGKSIETRRVTHALVYSIELILISSCTLIFVAHMLQTRYQIELNWADVAFLALLNDALLIILSIACVSWAPRLLNDIPKEDVA